MRLALMQPYFFPYLGYFQYIHAVDSFVFYDDVNFIKQGWINRNRILMDGKPKYITIPISKSSSFKTIKETYIHKEEYAFWKVKFFRSLYHHYGESPYYDPVFKLAQKILDVPVSDISTMAIRSVKYCSDYLEIDTEFKISSIDFPNKEVNGLSRIVDICKRGGAEIYINSAGGEELYHKSDFEGNGIILKFLHPQLKPYPQISCKFIPKLSIIDVLMNCSKKEAKKMLTQYTLQ